MPKPIALACLAALLLFAGCSLLGPDAEIVRRALTPQEKQLVSSGNTFGLNVFGALHRSAPDENLFVSPLSISMALGMALNGAEGETRDAMAKTLHVAGLDDATINASYQSLMTLLRGLDPKVTFDLANSIWYREGFSAAPTFLDVNRKYFDAEVRALDFSAPSAPGVINDWVSRKTRGKIPTIVEKIDSRTMMYLLNAIYFKGDWSLPFERQYTRAEIFRNADGTRSQVQMMRRDGTISYRQTKDFGVVDLPYGDSLYSMTIVLPSENTIPDKLIAQLDADGWAAMVDDLNPARLVLRMPRFKFSDDRSLKDVLSALGMQPAFDPAVADFSRIHKQARQMQLHVSQVRHKSAIEVDEKGTEAAAVTSVVVGVTSMPPEFHVDRPFLFAIRERHSGTILFMGKVVAL